MAPKRRAIGDSSLKLAEDYAAALRALEARSEAATTEALRSSLRGLMADLRRAYGRYATAAEPDGRDPGGRLLQRSGAAVIRETSARLRSILEISQDFLSEAEIKAWQERLDRDLTAADQLGGDLSRQLAELTNPEAALPFGGSNRPAIEAAVRNAGAYLSAEGARFREQIVQITADAAARGWGAKRMEDQVRRALEGAGDPTGKTARMGLRQRAALIARSELSNAYVQGQLEHSRRQGFDYVRWIAVSDERTCPFCASRHGHIYPASKVVVPAHPRCVLGDTLVSPGLLAAAMRSLYRGNVVTVTLDDGSRFTVTANHPMLTAAGVKKAELIRQGDQLVGHNIRHQAAGTFVDPDLNEVPARAEDVFTALRQASSVAAVSMPVAPVDLHGDGACIEGEIEVVRAAGFLQGYWDGAGDEGIGEGDGGVGGVRFRAFSAFSHADAAVMGLGAAACGSVSRLREALAIFRGGLSHADEHGLATGAWLDATLTEPLKDGSSAYTEALSELFDADPRLVQGNEVVNVEIKPWHGYVYTFETATGFYTIGDRTRLLSQNCRCVSSPVPREVVEMEAGEERDALLDEPFWQESRAETVKEYAKEKGMSAEKAASELKRYLKVPTATERRRYPGALESLMPSIRIKD